MKDYIVLRIYYRGSTEAHSIEYKDTLREAQTRFHNILAADEGNANTTYCLCMVFDRKTNRLLNEIHDFREENVAFYPVIRITEDQQGMNNSVQIFTNYNDAVKRWYGVIAADLDDESLTYRAAIMMDNNGMMGDFKRAFETPVEPEPEPEPTPDPEPEE